MSLKGYVSSTLRSKARCLSAPLMMVILAAASLQGCGTVSDMTAWAEEARELQQAEAVAKAVPTKADDATPDIPDNLAKCIMRNPKPADNADQWVANAKLNQKERTACAKQLLAWYKGIQKANKEASAASVAKRTKVK